MGSYITRHGAVRFLGEYDGGETAYHRGQAVIVRSERGLEVGEVLCDATPQAVQYLSEPTKGQIVRAMTEADVVETTRIHDCEEREFEKCQEFVANRKLQMELVDVEHLFGGERI